MNVLGTAGHVDHGKSSLLRVLTGMEPSRLEEERRREMTMQLGFVWFEGPGGVPVGIVDVPGHADYRRAMLTGISRVDAFLFVLACDDGWMPQSSEHLWALKTFSIDHGIIVLSKCDLVSPQRIEELTAEVQGKFSEAFGGKTFATVPFSAVSKNGFPRLVSSIHELLASLPGKLDRQRPELVVDRDFIIEGHGLVVTGTLRGGSFSEKDIVEVLPSKKQLTIKSIQSYENEIKTAQPNSRVALQFGGGIPKQDFPPVGSQVVAPNKTALTSCIDTGLDIFPGVNFDLKKSREVILVHSGARIKSKLVPAGEGERCFGRLHLESPRWICFGDNVLVLSSGADKVIGGGKVLDESAEKRERLSKAILRLKCIKDFSPLEYVRSNLARGCGFLSLKGALNKTCFAKEDLLSVTQKNSSEFFIVDGEVILNKARLSEWKKEFVQAISEFYAKEKITSGMPLNLLSKNTGIANAAVLKIVLDELKKDGLVVESGAFVALAKNETIDKELLSNPLAKNLAKIAVQTELKSFSHAELGIKTKDDRKILSYFTESEKIIRLDEDHVISGVAFKNISGRIVSFLNEKGSASVAEVRDHLGIGRKLVVMILECMDRKKITSLAGEKRKVN